MKRLTLQKPKTEEAEKQPTLDVEFRETVAGFATPAVETTTTGCYPNVMAELRARLGRPQPKQQPIEQPSVDQQPQVEVLQPATPLDEFQAYELRRKRFIEQQADADWQEPGDVDEPTPREEDEEEQQQEDGSSANKLLRELQERVGPMKSATRTITALPKQITEKDYWDFINAASRQKELTGEMPSAEFVNEWNEKRLAGELNIGPAQATPTVPVDTTAEELFALVESRPTLQFLPVLGQDGYFISKYSHCLYSLAKTGKTDLIDDLIVNEWREERILYFTEETREAWADRFKVKTRTKEQYQHVVWVHVTQDHLTPEYMLQRIFNGDETLVVIDTIRTLLNPGPGDDQLIKAVGPFVANCNRKRQTLICLHHERKAGGSHGLAAAGSHSLLAVVDRVLELNYSGSSDKRQLKSFGRNHPEVEMFYERRDGVFVPIGTPKQVTLPAVRERCLKLLQDNPGKWFTRKQAEKFLGDPVPSTPQIINAMNELFDEGLARRLPREGKSGVTYKWSLASGQP
jgi:hypothetical protein